jgi:hypothetical protein
MGDLADRVQDCVNNVVPDEESNYDFEGDMQEKVRISHK